MEKYISVATSYYRRADAAVLVYDISNSRSFQNIPMWLKAAEEESNGSVQCMVLIGNKSDLDTRRQVTTKEVEGFAKIHKCVISSFHEISAKTMSAACIEPIFEKIVKELIKKKKFQKKSKRQPPLEPDEPAQEESSSCRC